MIIIKDMNMPKSCDDCPLFVSDGNPAFCNLEAEYTDEEIEAEEDGNINMYYHGCLSHRPKRCPLMELDIKTTSLRPDQAEKAIKRQMDIYDAIAKISKREEEEE